MLEVSVDLIEWSRVIDHTQHFCRSWQHLYFASREVRYIRFFGTEYIFGEVIYSKSYIYYLLNNIFIGFQQIFALISLKAFHIPYVPIIKNGFVTATCNVATKECGAIVLTGKNCKDLLFNSSCRADSERTVYTSHLFGDGNIIVQLGQPCYIGSLRLLLCDDQNQSYRFSIQTSLDNRKWTMAVDRSEKDVSSESIFRFTERLVLYVKIIEI